MRARRLGTGRTEGGELARGADRWLLWLGDRCVAVRGNCLTRTTCPPDRCRAPLLLRERCGAARGGTHLSWKCLPSRSPRDGTAGSRCTAARAARHRVRVNARPGFRRQRQRRRRRRSWPRINRASPRVDRTRRPVDTCCRGSSAGRGCLQWLHLRT